MVAFLLVASLFLHIAASQGLAVSKESGVGLSIRAPPDEVCAKLYDAYTDCDEGYHHATVAETLGCKDVLCGRERNPIGKWAIINLKDGELRGEGYGCTLKNTNYPTNHILCFPTDDCLGVTGGTAVEDVCGICDGDGTSCLDCAGVPNGNAVLDQCDVCNGDGSSCGKIIEYSSNPGYCIDTDGNDLDVESWGVKSLTACKSLCNTIPECSGIEYYPDLTCYGVVESRQAADAAPSTSGAICHIKSVDPVGLEDCEWIELNTDLLPMLNHMNRENDYFGFTCPDNEIQTGFKLHDSGDRPKDDIRGNPVEIKCCDMFGHSAVTTNCDFSANKDVENNYVKCDASEHRAFCGVYDLQDHMGLSNNAYVETKGRKCCEIECSANYCQNGDWGIDADNCQTLEAEYTGGLGTVELVCPPDMILTKVLDKPGTGDIHSVNWIHSIECCALDIVHPPTQAPTPDPSPSPTSPPTHSPTLNPTFDPTSKTPTLYPTLNPTLDPTYSPSPSPSTPPTTSPTSPPSNSPTLDPTLNPTLDPTYSPSPSPSTPPTTAPTSPPSKSPTLDPTLNPTLDPTLNPTLPVRECMMKMSHEHNCEIITKVEDCMQQDIRSTCILVTTGMGTHDSGDLKLKVKGQVVMEQNFPHGRTWTECYEGYVPDFTLQCPSSNEWAGKIQVEFNGIPHAVTCDDCGSGSGPVGTWVFDGEDGSGDRGETTCFNGKECTIRADMITEGLERTRWYHGKKEMTMNSYDGCGVPAVDGLFIGSTYSVTSVQVNGGCASSAVYMQSTPVELEIDYLNKEEVCTGCIEQFYVGIRGEELTCVESVLPTTTQSKTTTLDISGLAVGTYEVVASATWEHECIPQTEGKTIFTLEVTADGMEVIYRDDEWTGGWDHTKYLATVGYALESPSYLLAVHSFALMGAAAFAMKVYTFIRPKQEYATIAELDL